MDGWRRAAVTVRTVTGETAGPVSYTHLCKSCLAGRPYACENFNAINFGGVMSDGTKRLSKNGQEISSFFGQSSFATYSVVHKNSIIKVDEDLELDILGPLGCGIQTGAGAVLNLSLIHI